MHTITTTLTLPPEYSHPDDLNHALRSLYKIDKFILIPFEIHRKISETYTLEQKNLILSEINRLDTGFLPFHINFPPPAG